MAVARLIRGSGVCRCWPPSLPRTGKVEFPVGKARVSGLGTWRLAALLPASAAFRLFIASGGASGLKGFAVFVYYKHIRIYVYTRIHTIINTRR
jgi:hypothetical protein